MIKRVKSLTAVIALAAVVSAAMPCQMITAHASDKTESIWSFVKSSNALDKAIEQKIISYLENKYGEGAKVTIDREPFELDIQIKNEDADKIANILCKDDKFVKKMLIKIGYPEETVNNMTHEQIDAVRDKVILQVSAIIKSANNEKALIYPYTASKDGQVIDKGFFVGGTIGAAIMQSNNGEPIYVSGQNVSDLNESIKEEIRNKIKEKLNQIIKDILQNGQIGSIIGNITDKITGKIDDITDITGDLADAMDKLSDSIKDKSDDIDDAWDKVFDRFDNDEGWGKRDGYIYYYDEDGISLKGVQKIDGKTYYFNRIDGAMETGWQIVDGKRCYFDEKTGRQLFLQWVQDGDYWYFLSDEGPVKKSEWINDNGNYYYVKSDGKRASNWLKIDDSWYYFNETTGIMENSRWKLSKEKWYYLTESGKAANDWMCINGKWYYFRENSCAMETGWFRADGSWYYSDSTGEMKTGWVPSGDNWCYMDDNTGKMKKNEWVYSNGSWYYFNVNGYMLTKSRYIDGVKYNFGSDGRLI